VGSSMHALSFLFDVALCPVAVEYARDGERGRCGGLLFLMCVCIVCYNLLSSL